MDTSQSFDFNSASQGVPFGSDSINLEYIFYKIYYYSTHLFNPFAPSTGVGAGLKLFLAIFTIFFIFVIFYCLVRILEIRKKEHEYFHHEIEAYRKRHAEQDRKLAQKEGSLNQRWDVVLQYLFSVNPGDWKLAIIEADAMLEGLMDQLGFKGENLGEKLKSADRDKFKSLTQAWEVHIIRNKIAHEGVEFQLSHHEAKRVVALYEQIFREFGYI